LFSKSCWTQSEQIKNDHFERNVVGFSYFSLISVLLFSIQDHPWILEDSDSGSESEREHSGSESEREQTPKESTVKPVHMVTSIQHSPVLKGNIFLELS